MPEVNLPDSIRAGIIQEAQQYALRPPGPNEVTVRILAEETDMTKKQARDFLGEKVRTGEYYVRHNGLNRDGKSSCYVYGVNQGD
jgi:hypothetical protein